jgi:hypothetical protein
MQGHESLVSADREISAERGWAHGGHNRLMEDKFQVLADLTRRLPLAGWNV